MKYEKNNNFFRTTLGECKLCYGKKKKEEAKPKVKDISEEEGSRDWRECFMKKDNGMTKLLNRMTTKN